MVAAARPVGSDIGLSDHSGLMMQDAASLMPVSGMHVSGVPMRMRRRVHISVSDLRSIDAGVRPRLDHPERKSRKTGREEQQDKAANDLQAGPMTGGQRIP